jgi:hypothetical protein
MKQLVQACRIVAVGKRRDGGTRYWCLEHKADSTAKYGRRARQCRYADIAPVSRNETLRLDIDDYLGGVAMWGAVPPIYDTTREPTVRGIHVHARHRLDGPKETDGTYRSVVLASSRGNSESTFVISELDAIYYMASSILGREMKYVQCTVCAFPHLDKDWFSVHEHKRHLCAGCGKQFRDRDAGIGNPIIKVRKELGYEPHAVALAAKSLNLRQADYPGGIQVWGSNPAIVWTASRSEEEGIHVHALSEDSRELLLDDTFASVNIDGVPLDPVWVRTFMAQSALPHIADRAGDLRCPECTSAHFDADVHAFTPHDIHVCGSCGCEFRHPGKLRKTIGNPMVGVLNQLGANAVRRPQHHDLRLLPETI